MAEPLGQLTYGASLVRGVTPGSDFAIWPVGKFGDVVGLVATEELARCLCDAWNGRQGSQPAKSNDFKLTP